MGMTDLLVAVRGSLVLRILSAVLLTCAAACSADVTTGVPASSASPQGPGFRAPSSELAKLPAVRPDSVIFGINGHPLMQPAYWFDDQTLDEQFDYLDSLRIHWYRVDMMPDPDGSLGPKFSKLMQAAARRGIHVLPVITNRPRSGQTPNEAYAEAYRMALGFASRYGQLFTHVEAGNELEGWPLWSGSRGKADGSDLSQYDADTLAVVTAWLRGLTRGLRAGAPKLRIIIDTGGWHHWAFFDALRRDTVEYDIVGYHWYSDMGDIAAPVAGGKSALDHLYALNKDIWITEINRRATIPDDPRDQNHWIYKYVRDFFGFSRVKAFFVYELYEQHAYLADDNPSNDTEALYGLVACPADPMQCTGRKVTKPAFDAYRFAIEEQLHGHEDYVASVYAHLLAREPDAKSLAHWTEVLESSNDRAALLRAFIPAGDYYERFVLGQYERLLGYDSERRCAAFAGRRAVGRPDAVRPRATGSHARHLRQPALLGSERADRQGLRGAIVSDAAPARPGCRRCRSLGGPVERRRSSARCSSAPARQRRIPRPVRGRHLPGAPGSSVRRLRARLLGGADAKRAEPGKGDPRISGGPGVLDGRGAGGIPPHQRVTATGRCYIRPGQSVIIPTP